PCLWALAVVLDGAFAQAHGHSDPSPLAQQLHVYRISGLSVLQRVLKIVSVRYLPASDREYHVAELLKREPIERLTHARRVKPCRCCTAATVHLTDYDAFRDRQPEGSSNA